MYSEPNKTVQIRHLGLMRYQAAWDYQTALFQQIVDLKIANRKREDAGEPTLPTPNYLLFCEHPHVYTLGKSGDAANLLLNTLGLAKRAAEFFHINRGGDITYHGPGQLVGYPILDLDNFFTDVHKYMRLLEESVIRTLADYGLQAGRIPSLTGVWLGHEGDGPARKICAIGVKMSRWVSMHGFAFNINTDLSYFGHIVPCGISDKAVTSLQQELGRAVPLAEVALKQQNHLATLFGMDLQAENA